MEVVTEKAREVFEKEIEAIRLKRKLHEEKKRAREEGRGGEIKKETGKKKLKIKEKEREQEGDGGLEMKKETEKKKLKIKE